MQTENAGLSIPGFRFILSNSKILYNILVFCLATRKEGGFKTTANIKLPSAS